MTKPLSNIFSSSNYSTSTSRTPTSTSSSTSTSTTLSSEFLHKIAFDYVASIYSILLIICGIIIGSLISPYIRHAMFNDLSSSSYDGSTGRMSVTTRFMELSTTEDEYEQVELADMDGELHGMLRRI
mmetsp:Transcript_14005/g.14100  ORF Transcript_14005/g.14100 Transcript_14005/m.14100 type:complete len:127 (+) Transcript_14005:210-590(+)